jgi:hypothetical protein
VCSTAANALFSDPVGAIGTLQQLGASHNFAFIVAITAESAT